MKRIYIFPRYSGDENSDWYQKVQREFVHNDKNINIIPLTLPNWDKPSTDEFLSFIRQAIPENKIDSNTYFIGHSIGCRAALLYLNDLHINNPTLRMGGLLCVAGWRSIDKPWPQLKSWIKMPIDFKGIKEICSNNIVSILSDNDPYTSDTQSNKKQWEENLSAKVVIVPGAKHFNDSEGLIEIINEILPFSFKLYFL